VDIIPPSAQDIYDRHYHDTKGISGSSSKTLCLLAQQHVSVNTKHLMFPDYKMSLTTL
jgi:hypothetical protein